MTDEVMLPFTHFNVAVVSQKNSINGSIFPARL